LTQAYYLIGAGIMLRKKVKELKDRIDIGDPAATDCLIKFLSRNTVDCIRVESNLKITLDYRIILVLLKYRLFELSGIRSSDLLIKVLKV
jgi:hypothetical protein